MGEVVILEQRKYLPSLVFGVAVGVAGAFDVVVRVSVEKYLKLLFKPLHDFLYDVPIIPL